MEWINILTARLRALFQRESVLRDIEEELRVHIEMEVERNIERGMPPDEAQAAARRSFGQLSRNTELSYDIRGAGWLETTWHDLRYGARMLLNSPGFTATVLFTLALGIGTNITIFSVVNAVLLHPQPYANADRLVFLWSAVPKQNIKETASAYATISEWRHQNRSFDDLAVFDPTSVTLTGAADPERVMSIRASANLFPLLGVAPELGRTFTADEVQRRARVVVLSHGLWQRRFGASPGILGQAVEIDGTSSQVIGVMPESFLPGRDNRIWEPHTLFSSWEAQKAQRGQGSWQVIGRLKASASLLQAQMEMNAIAQRLEQAYPDSNKDLRVNLVPFYVQLTGRNVRLALWILFGAVVCVLLISCTNVANLLLARGIARERELAIRIALGAGRMRLVRQLLTECSLLALLGGAVGLLMAVWGIQAIKSFVPPNIPHLDSVAIDSRALAFTTVVSLMTGLFFGLAPALKISSAQPGEALKEGRSSSAGIGSRRLHGLLVITEFGLAVLQRSFSKLQAVDHGFDATRVLLLQTAPALNSTADQWRVFYQQVSERIAALPGVEAAGLSEEIFISGNPNGMLTVEGASAEAAETARIPFRLDVISGGVFQTLRVPLRKGRFFNAQDNQGAMPVAIINETMAHRFWPGAEALGKRFKQGPARSPGPWLTVVGVVGDMRRQSLERQPIAQIFVPHLQRPERGMNLLIRTTGEPTRLAAVIRNEIRVLDKTVLVYGISTLESHFARAVAQRRFQTWLMTLFSALALLLAAVGIYGLIHQSVVMRTREIGTRLTLGAQPRDILRLIVGQGMRLVLCGIVVGLLAAYGLTRLLTGLLFGVTATDPMTFIATPLLLAVVAMLGCYLPARRATKIGPLVAMRHE
jgi:predicted permease